MSYVYKLSKKGLIKPPPFVSSSIQYEVLTGSVAYGVAGEASDWDIYGWCFPPLDLIFDHLAGIIPGFGRQIQRFNQYQKHGVIDESKGREYDISIYNIVKFFHLCMECNPNMIDVLFVPQRCILHITKVGQIVRENRKLFLHKGAYHRFKGYSYSQLHKLKIKNPTGKRKELVDKFGYDPKFSYHIVRLAEEVEQILVEGDLDLERNREQLKSIRRGEWSLERLEIYFKEKEKVLEKLYAESKLQHSPDEEKIKGLLLNCMEEYYGSLEKCIAKPDEATRALQNIKAEIDKVNYLL